jgi:hypothetical protein
MERMISSEEGKRLADSWKAAFLETSAKQNEVLLNSFFFFQIIVKCNCLSIGCTGVQQISGTRLPWNLIFSGAVLKNAASADGKTGSFSVQSVLSADMGIVTVAYVLKGLPS